MIMILTIQLRHLDFYDDWNDNSYDSLYDVFVLNNILEESSSGGGGTVGLDSFEEKFEDGDISLNWDFESGDDDWELTTDPEVDWTSLDTYVATSDNCDSECDLIMLDSVNLAQYTWGTLGFNYFVDYNVSGDEGLYVYGSPDGGVTWETTPIAEYTANDGKDTDKWETVAVSLSDFLQYSDFKVKFTAKSSSSGDIVQIDNIFIQGTLPNSGGGSSNSDIDGDGIDDSIDVQVDAYSNSFTDGVTSGEITDRGAQTFDIDVSGTGIGITTTSSPTNNQVSYVNVCDDHAKLTMEDGDDVVVECGGSVLLEVADDDENLSYTLYADNGNSFSGTLDDAEKLRFDETVPSISNESGNGNSFTVSGNSLSDGDTFTITDAPTIDSLVQNNDNSVDISFSVTNDGGSLITGYAVEYKKATDTTWNSVDFTSTSGTISGLEYDVYEFRAIATNFMGTSYSESQNLLIQLSDTTPPTFDTFPTDKTFEATAINTTLTLADIGEPTISDDTDSSPTLTYDPSTLSFPLGNTTITWTATDSSNNSDTATQTVTILDTTIPVITAPAAFSTEATAVDTPLTSADYGLAAGVDIFSPVAITSDAPATFPLGNTTITWTATDANGLIATAQQTVTILDTTIPVITAPAAFSTEATAVDTPLTSADYGLAAGVDIFSPVAITSDAPATFPLGNTTITWTATDANGLIATAQQTVTILDTTIPVITAPAAFSTEATAVDTPLTSADYGLAAGVDIFSPVAITSDAPATFPLGNTTITWTATDANGLIATAQQTVTILDTTIPVITAPAAFSTEATAVDTPLTSADYGLAAGVDIFSPVAITSDAPATFPLGNTTITWTATDANGLIATAQQTVTILDTTIPVITAPAAFSTEATAVDTPLTSADYGLAAGVDIFSPVAITSDAPATFPLGNTTITWTATDANGLISTATQTITVQDTTKPVFDAASLPSDVTIEATGQTTNHTITSPTATDIFTPVTVTDNAPVSFPLGDTVVTFTATDDNGVTATHEITVTVVDTTIPEITLLGESQVTITVNSNYVDAGAKASDNIDGIITNNIITNTVDTSILGSHTKTFDVADSSGNSATTVSREIIVKDIPITPPSVRQNVSATSSDGAISLTWDAPTDNGNSEIEFYKDFYKLTSASTSTWKKFSFTTNETSHTIDRLENYQLYEIKLRANNGYFKSDFTEIVAVVPS